MDGQIESGGVHVLQLETSKIPYRFDWRSRVAAVELEIALDRRSAFNLLSSSKRNLRRLACRPVKARLHAWGELGKQRPFRFFAKE